MARRTQHREVVGGHDPATGDLVDERGVGQLERDPVALAQPLDVRERGEVRRPMAGDVDELPFSREG